MAVKIVRAGLKMIPLALAIVGLAVSAYWIGLLHGQRKALGIQPAQASAPASNSAPDTAALQKQAADVPFPTTAPGPVTRETDTIVSCA